MRVLVVVADFPAISETFVLDQVTGLIDRGFTVDVLAARPRREAIVHPDFATYRLAEHTHYAGHPEDDRYGVGRSLQILFGQMARGRWGLIREMLRSGIRRKLRLTEVAEPRHIMAYAHKLATLPSPDVVVCHFGPLGDLMVRVRKATQAAWPIATFFHGYDISALPRQMGPRIYERLLREGDMNFPVSEYFRARLLTMGANPRKTHVQRMCGQMSPAESPKREKISSIKNVFTFVLVGRFVEKKGHEFAIRALALYRSRSGAGSLRLLLIGDGPLNDSLRQLAEQLDVHDIVEFRGSLPRNRVRDALLEGDAMILPSVTAGSGDIEGIPVVISEAMSVGLPVIATRYSGIPEIVEDGVTGILVDERDVPGLSNAMCRLAGDHELAIRLGTAGRSKLERDLNPSYWNDLLAERLTCLARTHATGR